MRTCSYVCALFLVIKKAFYQKNCYKSLFSAMSGNTIGITLRGKK